MRDSASLNLDAAPTKIARLLSHSAMFRMVKQKEYVENA